MREGTFFKRVWGGGFLLLLSFVCTRDLYGGGDFAGAVRGILWEWCVLFSLWFCFFKGWAFCCMMGILSDFIAVGGGLMSQDLVFCHG